MAITGVTHIGTAGTDTGGGNPVVTTTADVNVGEVIFVLIGKDNVATGDGTVSEITGVSDGVNTYQSAGRFSNGQGASNAGAYVDIWYTPTALAAQLASGASITVTKSTDVDCAVTIAKAAITTGALDVEQVQTNAEDNADAGSIATSGLASVEHLHIRAVASEYQNANNLTPTANFSVIQGVISAAAGLPATGMRIDGEYRVNTSTGETSDPTMPSASADRASILIAFKERVSVPVMMHHYGQQRAA